MTKTATHTESASGSADAAARGAGVLQDIVSIMGDEAGETEEVALLQKGYDAMSAWIALKLAAVGTPDDSPGTGPSIGLEFESAGRRSRKEVAHLRETGGGGKGAPTVGEAAAAARAGIKDSYLELGMTDAQAEIAAAGRNPQGGTVADSFAALGLTPRQAEIAARGRK